MVSWLVSIYIIFTTATLPGDYYEYSTAEFFELATANEEINSQEIKKDLLEAAVFHASNEVRAKKRKPLFSYDPVLQKAARFHADFLGKTGTVDHRNKKEKKYETPYDRVLAFGGDDFNGVAENLALLTPLQLPDANVYFIKNGKPVDKQGKPFKTKTYAEMAREVVDGWMNSKGHRKNLMDDYTYLGCGISDITYNKDGVAQINFVQNFGYK